MVSFFTICNANTLMVCGMKALLTVFFCKLSFYTLLVQVKVVDKVLYRSIYDEESRCLDRMENEWLPTMTLNTHTVIN